MIEISVFNGNIKLVKPEILTSGRIGHKIHFSFDNKWADLDKKASFQAGNIKKVVSLTEGLECDAVIPRKVLETPDLNLHVAVKGVSEDLTEVLPTKYIRLGYIHPGARILKEESALIIGGGDSFDLRIATEEEIDEMLDDIYDF